MFPTVLLALPLLLPMSNPAIGPRNDIVTSVPMTATVTSENRVASLAVSGPVIPPLYTGADGGFSLLLSPGSPCTAACLRLQGTF
jgi:hypothetical protein